MVKALEHAKMRSHRRRRESQPTTSSSGDGLQAAVEAVCPPNADERLARAYRLILRAAAEAEVDVDPKPMDGLKETSDG